MLSRLAFQSGLKTLGNGQKLQPLAVAAIHTNTKDTERTQFLIENWDRCNKKYFGPERDLVNFPHPTQPLTHEDVRLGFIPKSWFDAFYSKTGVSGPYFTLAGLTTYLMSKEIIVQDHAFFELIAFWGAVIFIHQKFGASIGKSLESTAAKLDEKNWLAPLEKSRSSFAEAVGKIDEQIMQEQRHKDMFACQTENVDMQLEARYRERMAEVHHSVKRRLDYQVELVNTKKRLEQTHMVNWIVDNVVKGITPKQEKDAISSCISNLRNLAKANPAAAAV